MPARDRRSWLAPSIEPETRCPRQLRTYATYLPGAGRPTGRSTCLVTTARRLSVLRASPRPEVLPGNDGAAPLRAAGQPTAGQVLDSGLACRYAARVAASLMAADIGPGNPPMAASPPRSGPVRQPARRCPLRCTRTITRSVRIPACLPVGWTTLDRIRPCSGSTPGSLAAAQGVALADPSSEEDPP